MNPLNEAQQLEFREKRNLYLFMICTALLSGNVIEFMNLSRKKHLMTDRKKVSKFTKVRGLKGPGAPSAPPIANEQGKFNFFIKKSTTITQYYHTGFPLTLKDALNPITLASFEDVLFRAEWQNGRFWEQRLENEKSAEKALMKSSKVRIQAKQDSNKCSIHGPDSECPKDLINSKIGDCLDKQFEYLLAMAESYKELLRRDDGGGEKVNRVNLWLQALSRVNTTACAHMKGIRNDYIMVLVGYLVNGELKGPFEDHPTENLQPLTQAIATYIAKRALKDDDDKKVPLNPASDTIENFMNECPIVEEGAFALLALSGNLFNFRR